MLAIYMRRGSKEIENFDNKDEALVFLNTLEENRGGYAIGVYNEDTKTIYLSNNMDIISKLQIIKELELQFSKVEIL